LIALAVLPVFMGGSAYAAARPPVFRGQPSVLSQADVERLSADADKRSIIILKDQHPEAPPRIAGGQREQAVDSDQAPIRGELAQLNAADVRSFHIVNAVAATISDAESEHLTANPAVQAVVPDAVRQLAAQSVAASGGAARARGALPDPAMLQQVCPTNPAAPLLEPEALQVMNVEFQPGANQPAAHDLVDGTGVKVGIIADGLDPNNPDLQRDGHSIVFDFQDFSGFGNNAPTDGREAFLDAGAIASQANQTYDLSGFVNPAHPLPTGCNIKIRGVAPGATLAVMNVVGSAGGFLTSQFVQAIEYAVRVDDVDVLNESLGVNPVPDTRNDPIQLANAAAVAGGVVVVVSSGDSGPTNTIGSPATEDNVIAVAGTTTLQVYRQTTRYETQLEPGGWLSNNITALSSAGTSEFGPRGPDVAAPGDRGWALCSSDTAHFQGCTDLDHGANPPPIWAAGGTSMSAPLTSGTAALVIQAYAQSHNGAHPTPDLVKRIIVSTAHDLGAPADHQGAGLVNSLKTVQLAESIPGNGNRSSQRLGNTLLLDRPNIIATAEAGAHKTSSVQVTNVGASAQTLSPAVVDLNGTPVSKDSGSLTLSGASPTLIDGEGNTDHFALHTFSVPANADYLNGDIVWDAEATTTGTAVFETLFDPAGRVAGYSLLGTNHSGRGHVEVRQPTAGKWTAAIFTVDGPFVYDGKVNFVYSTLRFEPGGSVSPSSVKLNPGQSATLHVDVRAANAPGDHVSSLRLSTGGPDDGSLPIILRSLVPINARSGASFSGTLTGGADPAVGQRLSYQFDVPDDEPSLNVAVRLRDPNYDVEAFLTDPDGEPLDIQSTTLFDPAGNPVGFGPDLQLFRRTPASGRWTFSLLVIGPIDGANLDEPFSATIDFTAPQVTSSGIPNSADTLLPKGKPVTASITIKNTGTVTKDFFADARLRGKVLQPLLGSGTANVSLPLPITAPGFAPPQWLVPPGTRRLVVVAQGTAPIVGDLTALHGDPDVLGVQRPDNVSVAQLRDPEIAPGIFLGLPEAKGPFPESGLGSASVNLAGLALTNPFDSAVVSVTGDVWAQSVDPNASYSPLTLGPGQSGVISLVFTPSAARGARVQGFIGVDTFNLDTLSGDEVIDIPYDYTVR